MAGLFTQLAAAFVVDGGPHDPDEHRVWMTEAETLIQGLYKYLDADASGADSSSAQPWFPTAGGVTLEAGAIYLFEGEIHISRAAGAVSHTTGVLFGGTATLTSIDYLAMAKEGDTNALADISAIRATAATELVVKAASTATTEQVLIRVRGVVKINAGGTLIPQFKYSAAPGGAPTIKRGSFFSLRKLGTAASAGTWA